MQPVSIRSLDVKGQDAGFVLREAFSTCLLLGRKSVRSNQVVMDIYLTPYYYYYYYFLCVFYNMRADDKVVQSHGATR